MTSRVLFMSKWIALAFSLYFISACATMKQSDCVDANWNKIGYQDGGKGLKLSMLDKREKSCNKHGISADRAAYELGRKQGLTEYCVESKGYKVGQWGREYHYVCPVKLQTAFLKGYVKGLNSAIEDQYDEIRELRRDIRRERRRSYSAETKADRAVYDQRVRNLKRRQNSKEDEVRELRVWQSIAVDNL